MTTRQMTEIVEKAIQQVQYDKFGLVEGFLHVRYIDKLDNGIWKIGFWLNDKGRDIQISISPNTSDEAAIRKIIAAIESNLPEWRKLIT